MTDGTLSTRTAMPGDAEAIARIYNRGIEERLATFETELRTIDDVRGWLEGNGRLDVVVEQGGQVVGWASAGPYRPGRPAYSGVAEFSVYVDRDARARGAGRTVMEALIREAEARGWWKLL